MSVHSSIVVRIMKSYRLSADMALVKIESYDKWLAKLLDKLNLVDINGLLMNDPVLDEKSSDQYLKSLDPKGWKDQDHYRILNIRSRHFASADEIKKQCIDHLLIAMRLNLLIIIIIIVLMFRSSKSASPSSGQEGLS